MSDINKKIILTAAVTGAIHTPTMTPYLPKGVDEIAKAAIDAAEAGASIVHIHARDLDGKPTSDLNTMGKILKKIKNNTDAIIGITTGGAIGMSVEERFAAIPEFKPEMASFNGGSINFNLEPLSKGLENPKYDWEIDFLKSTEEKVFQNTFSDMKKAITIMDEAGTTPEIEIFDLGQINNIVYLDKLNYFKNNIYFQFVPGVMGGIPLNPTNIQYFVNEIKKNFKDRANFSMVAGGRRIFRYETLSVILGGNVRVGLEDSIYINPNGELAKSNAEQVIKMKKILNLLDYEIASPDEARKKLKTKGKDKVNF